MQTLPHTKSCFVCGEVNPQGLRLIMETDGRVVRVRWRPRADHIGFSQTVHGGLIGTVLDEIMVWACAVNTRRFAYCAELTVRYRQPVRPEETVTGTAELVANQRQKIFQTRAELRNAEDQILAVAEGKYMPVEAARLNDLLQDAVGDFRPFVDLPEL